MDPKARAERILGTMETPGWLDVLALMDEQTNEAKEELFETMVRRPDQITGKKANQLAGRVRGLQDLKESLLDAVKPLAPTRIGRAE